MNFNSFCQSFSQGLDQVLPLVLVALALGTGCHVVLKDVRVALRNPHAIFVYLLAFFLVAPGLWLVLMLLLGVPADYAEAFLIIITSPGGLFGNVLTLKAHGDVGLSIGLTLLGTVVSLLTWGPSAQMWGAAYSRSVAIHIPFATFLGQATTFLLPLFFGMFLRKVRPRWTYWIRRMIGVLMVFVIGSFLFTLFTVKLSAFRRAPGCVWLMGLLGPVIQILIYGVARCLPVFHAGRLSFGLTHEQSLAVAFEFVAKNVGLVIIIAKISLPVATADYFVIAVCASGTGVHLMYVILLLLGISSARHSATEAAAAAEPLAIFADQEACLPVNERPPAVERSRSVFWGLAKTSEAGESSPDASTEVPPLPQGVSLQALASSAPAQSTVSSPVSPA